MTQPRSKTRPALQRLMHDMARYITAHADDALDLSRLAHQAQMSPSHFQKTFKAVIGLTPKAFHSAARQDRLKDRLKTTPRITQAIYDTGYGSSSRVYEKIDQNFGMRPKAYRAAGQGETISYASAQTPLGLMMIGATDRGICFLRFGDTDTELQNWLKAEYKNAILQPMSNKMHPEYERWIKTLNAYLQGKIKHLDLPMDIRGTAFQRLVWDYLQTIPRGSVRTYTQVAAAIGKPKAVRAAASACASNDIALIIPCHRVIRGDGSMGGYRWGLDRKRQLLHLEYNNDQERA